MAWLALGLNSVLATVPDPAPASASAFFSSTNLLTFQVQISDEAWERLSHWPRTYVPGTVRVGEQVYERVGVRLRGMGTFQPISRHPSLTLKFSWQIHEQQFAGLNKIYLNNSGQDATLLCEQIASEAFADAGVAAPRITQARLQLNGRNLGWCVVAEPVNKRFLRAHFGDAHGNLYEGEFRDIRSKLEQDNGPPSDQTDLRYLARAAALVDPVQRHQALTQLLDAEKVLDFMAVEMLVANWDGYLYHQNNYRIYHDAKSGCMSIVPHGSDNTFFESGLSVMPPSSSVLGAALISSPEDQAQFRRRVARLLPQVFDVARITDRIRIGVGRMSQGATPEEQRALEQRAALFEERIQERADHLQAELADLRPPAPRFTPEGVAILTGWKPKADWNISPALSVREGSRCCLSVRATNGFCFGSWRLPISLAPGRYRLQGLARADGVAGLPSRTGSGVGVRVLGNSRGMGLQGTCDWTVVAHEFVVRKGGEWVELVAELRAYRGTAWFDANQFQLVRLDAPGVLP